MDQRQRVGAYALVQDDSDAVLLCRMSVRSRTPGRWTLPGGGVRHGESPERAVLRELAEETGLSGHVEDLVGVHSNVYSVNVGESIHGIRLIYRVTVAVTGGERSQESDDTTDDSRWFSCAHAAAVDLSEHARYALRFLRAGEGDVRG